MKHAYILRAILLVIVAMPMSNCCLLKKNSGSSGQNTSDSKPVSTGSSECDHGVQNFNKQATGLITNDIKAVYASRGSMPEELKQLYPAAKSAWNRALDEVQSNYSGTYTASLLNGLPTGAIKEWRNQNLEDYQKFFLLLAEYRYGAYPEQSKDVLKKLAWVEKADAKKRLEAYVKSMVNMNCYSRDIELIKKLLDPVLLPGSIEACYL